MGFSVNSNNDAFKAYIALKKVNASTTQSQYRMVTRKQINSVQDDTSGYAVGKSLEQKISLSKTAQKNVGSAQDMLSTSESALQSIKDLVTSIKTKIADSTNPATDNTKISGDIKALASEIANIFSTTKFNNTQLLVSSSAMTSGTTFSFQTGAESTDKLDINYMANATGTLGGNVTLTTSAFTVSNLGTSAYAALTQMASVGTTTAAIGSLSAFLSTFEGTIDSSLSSIGNYQQRLTIKDEFLTTSITNSSSSLERIFDANIALEQMNATLGQIAGQLGSSILSQLNMGPQSLLSMMG